MTATSALVISKSCQCSLMRFTASVTTLNSAIPIPCHLAALRFIIVEKRPVATNDERAAAPGIPPQHADDGQWWAAGAATECLALHRGDTRRVRAPPPQGGGRR